MTFEELGRKVKTRIWPGVYDDLPDEVVARAFLEQRPEMWDLISPAAKQIQDLIKRNSEPSYNFPFFYSSVTQATDAANISRKSRLTSR